MTGAISLSSVAIAARASARSRFRWRLSQNSGDVRSAAPRRSAISAVTLRRLLTNWFTEYRDTPIASASTSCVMPCCSSRRRNASPALGGGRTGAFNPASRSPFLRAEPRLCRPPLEADSPRAKVFLPFIDDKPFPVDLYTSAPVRSIPPAANHFDVLWRAHRNQQVHDPPRPPCDVRGYSRAFSCLKDAQ